MMNSKIKQQEAAIEMIKMMVRAKRVRPDRLDAAINELNRLKSLDQDQAPAPTQIRKSKMVKTIESDASKSDIALKQATLSEEASRLRREQAELSNLLHKVPAEQECPELTSRILDLHQQIEQIWTQKKFLDRNDSLPVAASAPKLQTNNLGALQSKAELTVKIQKLREKRSKLKNKLENPKAGIASKSKWEIELAQVEAAIEESTEARALL